MNDEARRLFLMIVISVGFMLFYSAVLAPRFMPPQSPKEAQAPDAPDAPTEKTPPAPTPPPQPASGAVETTRPAPSTSPPEWARDVVVDTPLYRMVITTWGGRVKSLRLSAYPESKLTASQLDAMDKAARTALARAQSALAKADPAKTAPEKMEQLRAAVAAAERDVQRVAFLREWLASDPDLSSVELIPFEGAARGEYPLGLTLVDTSGAERSLDDLQFQPSSERLRVTRDGQTLELSAHTDDGLLVTRRYTFWPDTYKFGVDVSVENTSPEAEVAGGTLRLTYGPEIGLIPVKGFRGRGVLSPAVAVRTPSGGVRITWEKRPHAQPNSFPPPVIWAAISDKYFAAALIPAGPSAQTASARTEKHGAVQAAALEILHDRLSQGQSVSLSAMVYAGPKDRARLKAAGSELSRLIYYGKLTPISNALYWILQAFYRVTHNYGVSIILLALVLKVVFYPLTHKSFHAMHKMQQDMKRVQPEIDKLKEKYKDNPQKLNREIMAAYKKHGVNPLGGCKGSLLPTLLQMPVFFALYGLLPNAIELRGAPFVGWVKDLSQPDPWILPILMAGSMYLSQKLTTPQTSAGSSGGEQKMMQVMMPLLFAWIFRSFPSGLALYWLAYNIFTAIQQKLAHHRLTTAEAS